MITKPLDFYLLGVLSLGFVLSGMFLLILITFLRRWQQLRFAHYSHHIQTRYRPVLATLLLSGVRSPAAIAALRKLPESDLDIVLDPLFSKRRLSSQQKTILRNICGDLGLISVWQWRISNGGRVQATRRSTPPAHLRAKALRNLGMLAHQQSWVYLSHALDDPDAGIQTAGLFALAAVGGTNAFNQLRARMHALVTGECQSPPIQPLLAAMSRFDLSCVPSLRPSLSHANRQIRLHAMEVLRTMVRSEAVRQPELLLDEARLTQPIMELLLHRLSIDVHDEIRARTAEVLVYFADPRATLVLRNLMFDAKAGVRLQTLRSLPKLRPGAVPLHLDIRLFLRDPQPRVRDAAIKALISLKCEYLQELYRYFLNCEDHDLRAQIANNLMDTGMMSALVEQYSAGVKGLPALVVEALAERASSTGLWGALQSTAPGIRERFMERLVPFTQARLISPRPLELAAEGSFQFQQPLEFPSFSAA